MNDIIFNITFGAFGGIFAITFFLMGYKILRKAKKQKYNCTIRTYGKVVNNIKHTATETNATGAYENADSWHALFEYNVAGEKCVKESSLGTRYPKYEIGQTVEIYYNPENYHDFYVVGDTYPSNLGIILISIGIIIIGIVLFAIRP